MIECLSTILRRLFDVLFRMWISPREIFPCCLHYLDVDLSQLTLYDNLCFIYIMYRSPFAIIDALW